MCQCHVIYHFGSVKFTFQSSSDKNGANGKKRKTMSSPDPTSKKKKRGMRGKDGNDRYVCGC